MANQLKEILEKRNRLIEESRGILNLADKEKRAITPEEDARHSKLLEEATALGETIKRHQDQDKIEKEFEGLIIGTEKAAGESRSGSDASGINSKEYRKSMQNYFVRGGHALAGAEARALSQGSAPDGGFLVPDEQLLDILVKFVDDSVFIRQLGTVFKMGKAQSLGYPTLDTDMSDADWTSEVGTVVEDTSMKVGKRELSPTMLSKLAKISIKLLQNSTTPADALVLQRLAYKFGITQEKAFLTGNGASQPLGIFTASNLGIPTTRDVSTDNTSTAFTLDGLKNAKYACKGQYQAKGSWLFHRDAVKMLSKLKGTSNEYIWEPSVKIGDPDVLLGNRVYMSEYVPNTFTTGLYVGAFGDFSFYHIAEGMNFTVQRLDELYAITNQVGFIGRQEIDGMPALAEAFARVKLA
jgi:HK97 family phage major capsid protein